MPYDKSINFNSERTSTLQTNASFMTPSRFKLVIDSLKYPNTEFMVTQVELPTITATPVVESFRQRNVPGTPDKIDYSEFTITFLIDENMVNFTEMHDWIFGMVKESDEGVYKTRDMTLVVLNSNNNPIKKIRFINAFPTTLTGPTFDVTATDATFLTSTATFAYSYYTIE